MVPSAEQAITILTKMRRQLPAQQLAWWVLPNTILTLSGARPYCDGVYWNNGKTDMLSTWHEEMDASITALQSCTDVIWAQTGIVAAPSGESYVGFDAIFEPGMRYILQRTSLLQSVKVEQLKGAKTAGSIRQLLLDDLRRQDRFKDMSSENIEHVAAGILLGYPDAAIIASVTLWDVDDPFAEPLMDADIRGAGFYVCPEPRYMYPRHLVGDPAITAHEKLWSGILRDFYESSFHKRLSEDKKFQDKMRELGNFR